MKNPCKILLVALSLGLPLLASGANITLTASDANGAVTSLNGAGKWSNSQAPSAANDYYTGSFFIRTPADSVTTSYTFGGNSLTLQQPGSGVVRSIIDKSVNGDIFTINNLTNALGGDLENGGSGNVVATFTGNQYTIAANSAITADQGSMIIGYPLVGATGVVLTNAGGNAGGITYNGNNSGFQGIFYISPVNFGNGGGNTKIILNAANSQPGNPASLTPNQIWIAAGSTLQDNIGLAFTNSNGGFLLNGPGTANINAGGVTIIGEPVTDLTNGVHSICSLTATGAGTLILSNANNNYSGGTIISAGVVQLGVNNAVPGNTVAGDVTDNASLDLNTHNATINGLNGAGTVDTTTGGSPTLTVGANGDNGTFSGTIQNSSGTLALVKVGAGSETLSGSFTYSGNTVVAAGTLSLSTLGSVPSTPGSLSISNGAVLNVNVSGGTALPENNVVFGTNSVANLTLNPAATGISAAGSLTFQDNATNNFAFGTLTGNPTAPVITVAGGISAPGSNVVINITATGLQVGTITLIKYGTGTVGSLANFQVNPPPGVAATLVNNTLGQSIDLHIGSIPNQRAWNGVNGTSWDLSTANWTNTIAGGITVFQQYTNGSVIAGDAVTFDDTVTNDMVNPQPTNINLTSKFFTFPVVVNSSLPYSISGAGGITGVTALLITNIGSLTLQTSNSFTGGVNLSGGTLIITNDSALGASSGAVTLNGGTLQVNGGVTNARAVPLLAASTIDVATNVTLSLGGVISGGGASLNKTDNGTLILTARESLTGDVFMHSGTTIIDTGGSITNGSYHDVGQNTTDTATLTMRGTGSFLTTSDFNLGDLDSSTGTLNMQGSATLTMNAFYIGSANAAGSTASGIVNQTGGTITEASTAVGFFCIGGRTSTTGVGVYNMGGGVLTANAGIRVGSTGIGTLNQSGGVINALQGINIARIAGSFGTNNLNGGTLTAFNVASSTGTNAVFNFNGGTLAAGFNPATTTWFSGGILAYIQSGGAFVDSSNFNVTISTPLLAGSANGGLTKKGSGSLTLSGVNSFTGPITNTAGTLILNSASTYAGGLAVNAGIVQLNSATVISGATLVTNNATLAAAQVGSTPVTIGNLTLNGAASGSGAVLSLTPGAGNNPAVAMMNCGTLTLNGTNTFSLAAVNIGSFALLKYTGTIAGSGNITNLTLPQGASGFVSNSVANSTMYAVITSTGPGLVWTGTNALALNVWDINITTNWLVNGVPTSYHQIISPGDAVIFNDIGSGTVLLNSNAAPAGITISNSAKAYTYSGTGGISGPASLLKVGTGIAILNLTNDTYAGSTIISNGTLQIVNNNIGSSISPSGKLIIGSSGTLALSAQVVNPVTAVGEFTGSGQISYSGGFNSILSFGGNVGGTWNGTIRDAGGGGLSVTKTGTGTWIVAGTNSLNNSDFFNGISQCQFNGGTTIITNGGRLSIAETELWIAQGAGTTSTLVVDGGTIVVSNDWLVVGRSTNTANGTLIVNHGTVQKLGVNSIVVGSTGANGTLIVNGGQVLNDAELLLGESPSSVANLYLNGGLLQAADIRENNNGGLPSIPSVAYFNGGTLQANSNATDFIQVTSEVMSNNLVLDDNGFILTILSTTLVDGDGLGGGLVKKGAGTVYLDEGNTYTGTTVVTNGTLAGGGYVSGPLVVGPAGNLGAGDAGGIGVFSINNNLAMHGNATFRISKNGGSPAQDSVIIGGNIAYGGILTVTNVTSDLTPLASGDTFQLFQTNSATLVSGNFASIVGLPGAGLAYSFNPSSGFLSVVVNTVNTTPTNIVARVNGGNLELSWPADHIGWRLLVQTNSLATGLNTNWSEVPGAATVDSVTNALNTANGTVFYRMVYP